jgi:hypothetical protein
VLVWVAWRGAPRSRRRTRRALGRSPSHRGSAQARPVVTPTAKARRAASAAGDQSPTQHGRTQRGARRHERSRWRQDRHRVRTSRETEPRRRDRRSAPRRSLARPRALAGRTHQHPHAIGWRRAGHPPGEPKQALSALSARRATAQWKPRDSTALELAPSDPERQFLEGRLPSCGRGRNGDPEETAALAQRFMAPPTMRP